MSPAPPSPARTSARIASESPALRFDAVSNPLPERLLREAELQGKRSGSGYGQKRSGSGYQLPELANVQWEENRRGGWEAWHCPPGAIHRREKTYLGYLGVRQLRQWEQESPERFHELVIDWVAEKRKEKQIE